MSGTDSEATADSKSAADADESKGESRPDAESKTPPKARRVPTPTIERAEPFLLVALGGFAGAVLRHAVAVSLVATALLPGGFPWGTLAVNVSGSFALGVLLFEAKLAGRLGARTRLLLGTGFLSSFTTYSTFAAQTAALSPSWAVANVGANYALGFAAVLAGRFAVRALAGPEVAT